MTVAQITSKMNEQTIIHETAIAIAKLIAEAQAKIEKLEGDADAARETILELVTEE